MITLWPLAVITFKEGIRNRALYGISLIALLLLIGNYFISGMIPQEVGKVTVDMALSTITLSGLLIILFIGINLMAKDLDKRTIYMVLSKPISRSQYILGKFLGMSLLIIVSVSVLSIFALLSVLVNKLTFAAYFQSFSWSSILLAILFNTVMLILLSSLTFLFASITSTSFITLVLTIITFVIGQSLSVVKALVDAPENVGIKISPITVLFVRIFYYLFPNLSLFNINLQASHNLPVSWSYIWWTLLYGIVYTMLVVASSAIAFRKKEFL